jgi:alpha,alpha-trehalose phosphorylase
MAGNYMAIVYGFAGLRIKESGIWFEPTIPEAWNSYSFHLVYHGIDIDVYIDKCKCILKTNDELLVHVNGKSYEVKETLEIIL